jgi:hypothetical protein
MKPRAGPIQYIADHVGVGFVLHDDKGTPCATFVYPDHEAAIGAVHHIRAALAGVKSVSGAR